MDTGQKMRYFLVIAYDGTSFLGWQKQEDNDLSVQFQIEKCLSLLLRQKIDVVGCGRTDTGVHAKDYHLHFDTADAIDTHDTLYRLNKMLPNTIAADDLFPVGHNVHARFDAIERSYYYRMITHRDPFENTYCFHYPYNDVLDLKVLNEAAAVLLSYQDFYTFCKSRTDVKTTLCRLSRCEWTYDPQTAVYQFHITSDRFLRGMIRLIVGMCLLVNRGSLTIAEVRDALEQKKRLPKDWSVEGKGLFLHGIKYPASIKTM